MQSETWHAGLFGMLWNVYAVKPACRATQYAVELMCGETWHAETCLYAVELVYSEIGMQNNSVCSETGMQ
jgi:hypothetical protein